MKYFNEIQLLYPIGYNIYMIDRIVHNYYLIKLYKHATVEGWVSKFPYLNLL